MKNRDKKCTQCDLPVYARDLCRRHYKHINAKENNTSERRWNRIKNDPTLLAKKRLSNSKYRIKKKLGIDTTRKTDDNSLVNRDWQKYASLWTRKTNFLSRKSRDTQVGYHECRMKSLIHYSNGSPKCANCGVEDERVLTFDHLNNDGKKHRKEVGLSMVYWMVKNNFPPIFQVLCQNCNWLKELEVRTKKFDDKCKDAYKPLVKGQVL